MSEHHEKRFKGNWAKAEVFELVEEGEITIKEAWILLVIDNLCFYGGQDCFASNAYLASKMQIKTERQVRRMISHLKELGLLIQTGFDGRKRYLSTVWSHLDRNSKADRKKKPRQRGQKSPVRGGKNARSPTGSRKDEKDKITLQSQGKPARARVASSNSKWIRYSEKLAKALKKVRKINSTSKLKAWPNTLRLLNETDEIPKDQIKTVLKWYCNQLNKHGDPSKNGNPHFIPVVYSASAFRSKFHRLEAAMDRASNKRNPTGEKVIAGPVVIDLGDDDDESKDPWED